VEPNVISMISAKVIIVITGSANAMYKQVFIEKQNTCLSGKYSISKQFIAKY
jgi:hypothetical protein